MKRLTRICLLGLGLAVIGCTTLNAQFVSNLSYDIGDDAQELKITEWVKGPAFSGFTPGKVYVVELWATWCKPCKAAMPHLSELADKYKGELSVIGLNLYESQNQQSRTKAKEFVQQMGANMSYSVALGDSSFIDSAWIRNSESGWAIPKTFVIDQSGKLAWIGHPYYLGSILPAILSGSWNLDSARDARKTTRRISHLDHEAGFDLLMYAGSSSQTGYPRKVDSLLYMIDTLVNSEPALKYAPSVAAQTFSALLETDIEAAITYGNELLETKPIIDSKGHIIVERIEMEEKIKLLPSAVIELGARACQNEIDYIMYPNIANPAEWYGIMAEFYWRLCQNEKAVTAMQNAVLNAEKYPSRSFPVPALKKRLEEMKSKSNLK